MKKYLNNKKTLFLIFSIVFLVLLNFILVRFASRNPMYIENLYSRNFFLRISNTLSFISRSLSFSLGELTIFLFMILIAFLLVLLIYNLIIVRWQKSLNYLLIIIVILMMNLTFFQIAWGLNNYRLKAEDNFNLKNIEIDINDMAESYKYLVLKTNSLRQNLLLDIYTKKYIYQNSYKGYEFLSSTYSFIDGGPVTVKPLLLSNLFSSSGYAGIYIPFFAEPNVNSMMPKVSIPFASSHEIAHQKGFAGEDEANFVGFLACSNHKDDFFKYSGYLYMMIYLGNSLYENNPSLYIDLSSLRSEDVLDDLRVISEFWNTHKKESVSKVHNKANDSFLKANNQPEGILTYSKVSELFVKAYKKGLFE